MDTLLKKNNENKYLIFAFMNKNKEVFKKYSKPWNEIKNQIKTISGIKAI